MIATSLAVLFFLAAQGPNAVGPEAPDGVRSDQHTLYLPWKPADTVGIFVGPTGEYQFRCGHCTKFFRVKKDKDWSHWMLMDEQGPLGKANMSELLFFYRQQGYALQFTYISAELPE